MAHAMVHTHAKQVKVASGLDIVAALWLFISAFTVPMPVGMSWSNAVAAVLVCGFAIIRSSGAYEQVWLSWVNVVLGAWVFFSPWILGFGGNNDLVANNVITGAVIFILALWSALASNTEHRMMTA